MTDNQKQQIKSLRLSGFGYKKVAQELRISVDTVKSYCRKHNLTGVMAIVENKTYCRECGKELIQPQKKKPISFCCEQCRVKWWKTNKSKVKNTIATTITCKHCGKEVLAYKHEQRKYCSHQCYIADRFKGGAVNE